MNNHKEIISFHQAARLPEPGDNAAIAVRRLEAGTLVRCDTGTCRLSHTVLEGHRFAIKPILSGEALLSWGLPFGYALRAIGSGEYLVNAAALDALRSRRVDFILPEAPNFVDRSLEYHPNSTGFVTGIPLPPAPDGLGFSGYSRPGGRGAGTRNYIVLLGLSSYTNGFVRRLERRLQDRFAGAPNLDGVAAVAHTEGSLARPGSGGSAEERERWLRTLAGFIVHPNTGAVLLIDRPGDDITWDELSAWMIANGYPLEHVPYAHLALGSDWSASLVHAEDLAAGWLPWFSAAERTEQPLRELKVALQCGGSDAFSGISGNPLAALAAREVLRRGGSALLAETPELVGAEAYLLANVRAPEVAQRFLAVQDRFMRHVAQYGVTVEGNISGGNRYRGLYNITLKSIGAARKRHPDVPLDGVLEYAERLHLPGYYFMDSPGNDLESIAGQVAAGCNLVIFVTGNGSVTNFPFVPTIKVVTTSGRYRLMPEEMDVNAGRYLDGEPLEALGEELFGLVRTAAGGERTAGEWQGHSQVHLWRAAPRAPARKDEAIPVPQPVNMRIAIEMIQADNGFASELVGLVLPGSLCSAQTANWIAARLTTGGVGRAAGIRRYTALAHTEGCGSSGNTDEMLVRTLAGYLRSPMAACGVVLEHGCERTLNVVVQQAFVGLGLEPSSVGWASLQMDGGLRGALAKIEGWFRHWAENRQPPARVSVGMEAVRLGLVVQGSLSRPAAQALAGLIGAVTTGGGGVVSAYPVQGALVLGSLETLPGSGLYHMPLPTDHWTEQISGLGAAGLNVILGLVEGPLPGHPLLPVLQVGEGQAAGLDLALQGDPAGWAGQMLELVSAALSGDLVPLAQRQGFVDFQLTRGSYGVSL